MADHYQIGPTLNLRLKLRGGGEVVVVLDGEVEMPCSRGEMHHRNVSEEVVLGPNLCRHDLNVLEGALRGDFEQVKNLASMLLDDLQRWAWTDPCNFRRQTV